MFPIDDYWKKEFLGDNTAMLLTDVSRDVKNIKEFLQENLKSEVALSSSSDGTDEIIEGNVKRDDKWEDARLPDVRIEVRPRFEEIMLSLCFEMPGRWISAGQTIDKIPNNNNQVAFWNLVGVEEQIKVFWLLKEIINSFSNPSTFS